MNHTMKLSAALAAVAGLTMSTALAGPVIIDGTDANDHGSVSLGVNQNGWAYMQSALQNVGGQVGNNNKIVVNLGAGSGEAFNAITSAFNLSSLAGAGGWTMVTIDGAANITSFLAGNAVNGASLATAGLLYLPTAGLTGGDRDADEVTAVNAGAAAIASFVGGAGNPLVGGGLFSMGENRDGAYGWLTTLIPGIVATDSGASTDITLTAAGNLAFPGLSNATLAGADPWHGHFSGNLGSLSVLATALQSGVTRNVVIGGGAGTVITSNAPDSLSVFAILPVLFGLLVVGRRMRRTA